MSPPEDMASEVTAGGAASTVIRPDVIDHSTTAEAAKLHGSEQGSGKWMPQTVLATIPACSQPATGSSSPIAFLHILTRLKETKREGWRRFGISGGESISDHMYRMAIMTMIAPAGAGGGRLDTGRCTKMALVHDMAELLVGDITPVDGVSKPEKSRREAATIDWLCESLLAGVDGGVHAREIRALWHEYEDSVTPESRLVHDIDKTELLLQMVDYERAGGGALDLGEFAHVATRIESPEIRAWADEILAERKHFWAGLGKAPSTGEPESGSSREQQLNEYYKHNNNK